MITFTQYLRPDGRKRTTYIERTPEIHKLADWLRTRGCYFEIEETTIGTVVMYVENDEHFDSEPVAMEICGNNEDVPKSVDKMIRGAVKRLSDKLIEERMYRPT